MEVAAGFRGNLNCLSCDFRVRNMDLKLPYISLDPAEVEDSVMLHPEGWTRCSVKSWEQSSSKASVAPATQKFTLWWVIKRLGKHSIVLEKWWFICFLAAPLLTALRGQNIWGACRPHLKCEFFWRFWIFWAVLQPVFISVCFKGVSFICVERCWCSSSQR